MTVTPADRRQIAAAIRLAGELTEAHLDLALRLTDDWTAGTNAANLDPDRRGNRNEPCGDPFCTNCPHPIPSDPTGEAAVASRRTMFADEFQTRLTRAVEDCLWLRDAYHVLAPIVPPSTMNERNDLWCAHHLRIGLCEVRHRGELCRWCYEFELLWKVRPPVALLRDRHLGRKLTEKSVKAALEADGVILKEVAGVAKAVTQARRPNQNEKRKRAAS